jgi:hypothetical protein
LTVSEALDRTQQVTPPITKHLTDTRKEERETIGRINRMDNERDILMQSHLDIAQRSSRELPDTP